MRVFVLSAISLLLAGCAGHKPVKKYASAFSIDCRAVEDSLDAQTGLKSTTYKCTDSQGNSYTMVKTYR
jgi:hypothetical protein